jgi:alpha-D-ribose 1-methylphosphonate 5-triphosphate synthase subunit PhnG
MGNYYGHYVCSVCGGRNSGAGFAKHAHVKGRRHRLAKAAALIRDAEEQLRDLIPNKLIFAGEIRDPVTRQVKNTAVDATTVLDGLVRQIALKENRRRS